MRGGSGKVFFHSMLREAGFGGNLETAPANEKVVMSQDRRIDANERGALRWLGVGIEFGGVIAIFTYIGYRLDEFFNISPWLLLTGFFVGFTGMIYLLFKESRQERQ